MPKLNRQAYVLFGFLAGSATTYIMQNKLLPKKEPSVSDSAACLSKALLTQGWKPLLVKPNETQHPGIPPIYVSVFKPGLTASTGYGFIKQGEEFFVLLNKQKRCTPEGKAVWVADVPCGFYNADQPHLAHTQTLVSELAKVRSKKKLTSTDVQELAVFFKHHQVVHHTDSSQKLPLIDLTAEDNARRELLEETGFSPKNKGQLINVESVNSGTRWYHRFYFLDELAPGTALPVLNPASEEGIVKSCWVNAKDIHFNLDETGKPIGGMACLGGETIAFKQTDKTALNLAYAMGMATEHRYGSKHNPGQSYEDPSIQITTIGMGR